MACRATLLAVLPSTCSALAVHTAAPRDASFLDAETRWQEANQGVMEQMLTPAAEVDCQEAQAGSECYLAVQYLRLQGFESHPTWYPGYSSRSSFGEVQDMLYGLMKSNCPKPCFVKASPQTEQAAEAKFNCKDTAEGDLCYASIAWLKEVGFGQHPDWYPNIGSSSSTAAIQAELHRRGKADCRLPCTPHEDSETPGEQILQKTAGIADAAEEDADCMDAQVGTACYNDVAYGIAEGIRKHPIFYEGLKNSSNFKEVQEYLYLNNRSFCTRPCPAKRVSLDVLATHPEELKEKKRIQDMSIDELSAFLNGDWDGYVAKAFQSQGEKPFEKRKYDPITTTASQEAIDASADANASSDFDFDYEAFANAQRAHRGAEAPPQTAPSATDAVPLAPSSVTDTLLHDVDAENAPSENTSALSGEGSEAAENSTVVEASTADESASNASVEGSPTEEAPSATAREEAVSDEFPEAQVVPTTEAARALMTCLATLRDVTPENFVDLKAECESAMPHEGEQRGALEKEFLRFFIWAQHHVQELKAKREANAEVLATAEVPAVDAVVEESAPKADAVVDEPAPTVDAIVGEPAPGVGAAAGELAREHAETPEEMEERLRKQVMEELNAQTTTVAPHKETEEEMRARIKAEIMRSLETSNADPN